MKSWKRPWRFVLFALVPMTIVACGGPDIGVTRDEILIGTWTPLTGPASHLSAMAKAMDAHFRAVNDEGGIHGRRLRLIIKDDGYDPERTPGVVRELIEEDGVFAIVGGNGTANCLAVKDYLERKFVPWINPGSGSRVWTTPLNPYIFSIQPTYVTEGMILARYAVEDLGLEKIALVYQDDSFGREGQEGVRLGLRDLDKELVAQVSIAVGEEDLSAKAQEIKDAEAEAVLVWAIPQGAAALVRAFRELDYAPQILATQVLSDPILFDLAGEGWEGAIVATGVPDPDSDEPGVVRARELLSKYGPDVPFGTFALMGIARSELLVEGIRRAGPELTRIRLIHALENMQNWTDNILGRPISFTPENHQGFNAVRLMKAEGGKYVYVSDWLE